MSIKDRGLASMSKSKRRAIAAKGGKRAHEMKKAHRFTKAEAAEAGRKSQALKLRRQAIDAATTLMKKGFPFDKIANLELTDREWIYYGKHPDELTEDTKISNR